MNFRLIATYISLIAVPLTAFAADDMGCAPLSGAVNSQGLHSFKVRDGEPVDLVAGTKTVHGTLHVFGDGGVFRAYWQPADSQEKYVLATAGVDSVRLVSTPPQGTPVTNGDPGTTLAPQHVLSCPTL
ncbi:hypothetical protein AAGS40_18090 [Paraburkholderia sp. PREW-6R]|uniref:hypothetical protein n=1 Tax=Paraburkholderia sp. PREW-6R TaxID=3141544 RepID=UPI0031F58249